MRHHAQLRGDRRGTRGVGVMEARERDPRQVAQDPDVVLAESTGTGDPDAECQNPIPRSLSSMNVRKASTSGNACSSARARAIACDTFSSERNTSR